MTEGYLKYAWNHLYKSIIDIISIRGPGIALYTSLKGGVVLDTFENINLECLKIRMYEDGVSCDEIKSNLTDLEIKVRSCSSR